VPATNRNPGFDFLASIGGGSKPQPQAVVFLEMKTAGSLTLFWLTKP
jgi:hypothetical protein